MKVDGSFNQVNFLQELSIDFADGLFFRQSPKFRDISLRATETHEGLYDAYIEGSFDKFEMTTSENFIGVLPSSNFVIDLLLDLTRAKANAKSKINFNTLSSVDILGSVEVGLNSEPLINLGCILGECGLSLFNLSYNVSFEDEWVKGSADCPKNFCGFSDMEHFIRTSNTYNILKILNQESIVNPLSSLYLFGVISSGQEIDGGHELKF